MIKLDIHDVWTRLSRYLARLEAGDRILLGRHKPVAEIRPLPQAGNQPRPVGLAKGRFAVPTSYFEPLPDEVLDAFSEEWQ